MEKVHMAGAKFIESLQSAFGTQHSEAFTFWSTVGNPQSMSIFFFPLVFNLDGYIGCKLIWVSVLTQWINTVLKWTFHGHRPYWWVMEHAGPVLHQFRKTCETGPGSPSGHMMCCVAVGYCMLQTVSKRANFSKFTKDMCLYALVFSLFMVAMSRMYLAAHFPHQVIAGSIAGFLLGHNLECLNPTKMKLKDYLLTSALIVIVGGAMYIVMKMFHIDPMWSVAKAEYYCTVTHGVRHKHNVWATFVRSANTLLGVGFGLLVTGDKQHWACETPTWLRVVGGIVSVSLAQFASHHIHVSHHQHTMFYTTIAAKAFGTAFLVVIISDICRRIGEKYKTAPAPKRRGAAACACR